MAELRMPKMGDGMEEGTINVWLKKEGELVKSGEPIAEVETDKASVEISSYETGTLTKIIVPVGKTVPVGEIIAMIGDGAVTSAASAPSEAATAPATSNGATVSTSGNGSHAATPSETVLAAAPGVAGERVKASPLARRVAAELGLDIALIAGSGPGGRIVERDVRGYAETAGGKPQPVFAPIATAPTVAPSPVATATLTGAEIDPTPMRKAIARRTQQSKQQIPHFYVTMVVEMDKAQRLLKELNADATDGKITVNDLIVKACATALGRVPEVNATWTADNKIKRYAEAHIGIAVGIDDGLIIPVVRDCHAKTLREISADAKALIGKARNGQLKPDEYSGGTFSVSNLGMMGVDEFTAIINPPEAAILAIGGIVREPVVTEKDEIVIRSRMKITLSADHRLLDGVSGARFLQEVRKALESPYSLLS